MRRTILGLTAFAAVAAAAALFVNNAGSQPRITTTRQVQIIGAAATNQTHGAWFIDLQASTVIFCERAASGIQCQTAPIP